ncbi:MAG: hypothetical protein U0V75_16075 [Ferruginibacter sp.]
MKHFIFLPLLVWTAARSQTQIPQPVKTIEKPATINKSILSQPAIYDFSKVRICVDKKPLNISLPPRSTSAGKPIPKINSDGSLSQTAVIQQGLSSATEKMWSPGDVITVYLSPTNGSDYIRQQVVTYAKQWEQYANIKFSFINDFKSAKVKVGFFNTGQSWSWLGRDVLSNPFNDYTMNFGWFDYSTTTEEFSRTITHEFGHVLGLLHEHQSPVSTLQWNLPKTYQYFKEKNGWDEAGVNDQVINKYAKNNTNFSQFDPFSIMCYRIPDDLLLSGTGAPMNSTLSATDKLYARVWYPFPPTGYNAIGNIRTNDDCDDVAFSVQYNVVPADVVEFTLELGQFNNKKVTWWKQVGIPKTNNTETFLWVQNHSLIASENRTSITLQIPVAEIDFNKPISFWKAKFLGAHTLLPYKWNVLAAIKGGCRISLSWNRDSCAP